MPNRLRNWLEENEDISGGADVFILSLQTLAVLLMIVIPITIIITLAG